MDRIVVQAEPVRLVLTCNRATVTITHNEPPKPTADWWKWASRTGTVVGLGRFVWDVLSLLYRQQRLELRMAD